MVGARRRAGRKGSRQRGSGSLAQATGARADAGAGSQTPAAPARVSDGTRALRAAHRRSRADRLRRQRPYVRARTARLRADAGRHRPDPAARAHFAARRPRQRRRLRASYGVRRQAGVPALRAAVRRQRDPDDGDQHGRSVEIHRHERRRRGRQEGSVHDRFRPRRHHGIAAVQPLLGDGQLDVQHGQRVQSAMDAERPPAGTHRTQQRAMGRHAG